MQNPKECGEQLGYVSDYDQFVSETPHAVETFQSGIEQLTRTDLVKQDHPSTNNIYTDYEDTLKNIATKKVWKSSGVDLSELDIQIAEPYKVIMESAATGDFDHFTQLQKDLCSYFGMAMYRWAVVNQKYMRLVTAMRSLYWIAEEGGEVIIETNIIGYDFGNVFKGLDRISSKSISKNSKNWNGLDLYPIVNFPVTVKRDTMYAPLTEIAPDFLKVIKKLKLMLYVTSDFNLAIDRKLQSDKNIVETLEQYWQNGHYQFKHGLKLYLIG